MDMVLLVCPRMRLGVHLLVGNYSRCSEVFPKSTRVRMCLDDYLLVYSQSFAAVVVRSVELAQ